jgi:hypothetical protein
MPIADEVEAAVDVLAPQVGVSLKIGKVIAWVVLAVLAIALAWFLIWKLFIAGGQAQQKHEVAAAKAQAQVGQAQGAAGAAATNIVAGNGAKETITHEITRDHYAEITKQPGAGDPVTDAVDSAGRRAICMRASAAGLPDCQRLREAGP